MSNKDELQKLRDEEQELIRQLKTLEQLSNNLQNQSDKEEEKKSIDTFIASRKATLEEIRNEISTFDKKETEISKEQTSRNNNEDKASLFEKTKATVDLINHIVTGGLNPQINTIEHLQSALNQSQISHELVVENKIQNSSPELICVPAPVIENAKENIQTQEKLVDQKKEVQKEINHIEEGIKEAYEHNHGVSLQKESAKEWEKEIDKKEKAVNEKFDKEIKDTEKSLQKQIDYIDKKYENKDEKETKTKELKDTIEKVKVDIEKDRSNEVQKLDAERAKLDEVKQATKNMEEKERQKEIERQRQLELERQRQLEERNRNH